MRKPWNLVKLCFPELPEGAECSVDEVRKLIVDMTDKIVAAMNSGRISMESFVQAARALSETGCSVEEAIGSCTGGPQPQPPKYVSTGTLSLSAYDGTTKEGRQQLKTDLGRPGDYYYDWNRDKGLLPNDKGGFTFNFPGETPVVTGASDTPNRRVSRSSSTGRPRSTSTAIRLPPRSRSKIRSCDHSLLRV